MDSRQRRYDSGVFLMDQCKICNKTCIAKTMPDPCKVCLHNNRKERLKTCIDCGISCRFDLKTKKATKGRICAICGRVADLQEHHLLRGVYRSAADKYNLTIYICGHCHNQIHNDPQKTKLMQVVGQVLFEQTHTRDQFRTEFGQSFIVGDNDERAGRVAIRKMRNREPLF